MYLSYRHCKSPYRFRRTRGCASNSKHRRFGHHNSSTVLSHCISLSVESVPLSIRLKWRHFMTLWQYIAARSNLDRYLSHKNRSLGKLHQITCWAAPRKQCRLVRLGWQDQRTACMSHIVGSLSRDMLGIQSL